MTPTARPMALLQMPKAVAPRNPERLPMTERINPAKAKVAPKKGTGAMTTEVQPKLAPRMVANPSGASAGGGGVIAIINSVCAPTLQRWCARSTCAQRCVDNPHRDCTSPRYDAGVTSTEFRMSLSSTILIPAILLGSVAQSVWAGDIAADKAKLSADKAVLVQDHTAAKAEHAVLKADRQQLKADHMAKNKDAVAADKAKIAADKPVLEADRTKVKADRAVVKADRAAVHADHPAHKTK